MLVLAILFAASCLVLVKKFAWARLLAFLVLLPQVGGLCAVLYAAGMYGLILHQIGLALWILALIVSGCCLAKLS